MCFNFSLGDSLVRFKNSILTHKHICFVPKTKLTYNLLNLLLKENLIISFYEITNLRKKKKYYKIFLRQISNDLMLIKDLKLISKPSRRIYLSSKNYKKYKNTKIFKAFLVIISTSSGLLTLNDCLIKGIGGEILLVIYC